MRIHGFVVSVNYSAELAKCLPFWMPGLDALTVVTDLADDRTAEVSKAHDAEVFRTDGFYRDFAYFNKGRAYAEAYAAMNPKDWVLLFDADITPESGWRTKLGKVEAGWLYGAARFDESGVKIREEYGHGWFQLFHSQDPLALASPLFETCWTHAGVYDSVILLRWRNAGRLAPALPVHLTHAGIGPSENWFGRGRHEEFKAMKEERIRRGGGWPSLEGERLSKFS